MNTDRRMGEAIGVALVVAALGCCATIASAGQAGEDDRYEGLIRRVSALIAKRDYERAASLCRAAAEKATLPAWAKRVERYANMLEGDPAGAVREALRYAEELVGKQATVELRLRKGTPERLEGKLVTLSGDGVFTVQVAGKRIQVRLEDLASETVARLAKGEGYGSLGHREEVAGLLYFEAHPDHADRVLALLTDEIKDDGTIHRSPTAKCRFFQEWQPIRYQVMHDQMAVDAIASIRTHVEAEEWPDVIRVYRGLCSSTQSHEFIAARAEVERMVEQAQQRMAEDPRGFVPWKRIGASIPIGLAGKRLAVGCARRLKFAPKTEYLAVAHSLGVDLWNPLDWSFVRRLDGHEGMIRHLQFTSDGAKVAASEADGRGHTEMLWDVENGRCHRLLKLGAGMSGMAVAPEGDRVAVAKARIYVYDAKTGARTRVIRYPMGWHSVCFTQQGKLIAGCTGGRIFVWDATTWAEPNVLTGSLHNVVGLFPDPRGKTLVSFDGFSLREWHPDSGKELGVLAEWRRQQSTLAYDGFGRRLARGTRKGFEIWDLRSDHVVKQELGRAAADMCFSPHGELLAVLCGASVRVYVTATGTVRHELPAYSPGVDSVAISPADPMQVVLERRTTAELWNAATGERVREWSGGNHYCWLGFTPRLGRLIMYHYRSRHLIQLWEPDGIAPIREIEARNISPNCTAVSPDEETFATGGHDRVIRVYDLSTGELIQRFTGHQRPVRSVAFNADGNVVVSGSDDMTVRLWHVDTGKCLRVFHAPRSEAARHVALSPPGRLVAAGGRFPNLMVWDAERGTRVSQSGRGITEYGAMVCAIACDPTGADVATGFDDGMIGVWELRTGRMRQLWRGHHARVTSLSFSRDGTLLASSSWDGTAALWRRSGSPIPKSAPALGGTRAKGR